MRKLLVVVLMVLVAQSSRAQDEIPPLVGPVVYGEGIEGIAFQDLGTGEVWEISDQILRSTGEMQSWSPDGCYGLYGEWSSQQHALIDLAKHTAEGIILPLNSDQEGLSIAGEPQWSPDGRRLAYSAFDGANTTFNTYDLATGETQILYVREGYEGGSAARVVEWPSEQVIRYLAVPSSFELNLETGEIAYLLRGATVNVPFYPAFSRILRSPNHQAIAAYFDLPEAMSLVDFRFSPNNADEVNAINQVLVERPGIEIYLVDSGETLSFDLDEKVVSTAAWSPDGRWLALLTWSGDDPEATQGAFIYDLDTNTMTPVLGLRPVRYGFFQVNWSTNSDWVILYGQDQGWVAYNVSQDTMIQLAEPFQETISIMRVSFSPVTYYEPGACD